MNTKLTLTVQKDVIKRAKEYAKSKNRSLSDLVQNYLMALTESAKAAVNKIDQDISTLQGSFRVPADSDYKKELQERREKKYL